jgi:hypothetical protein
MSEKGQNHSIPRRLVDFNVELMLQLEAVLVFHHDVVNEEPPKTDEDLEKVLLDFSAALYRGRCLLEEMQHIELFFTAAYLKFCHSVGAFVPATFQGMLAASNHAAVMDWTFRRLFAAKHILDSDKSGLKYWTKDEPDIEVFLRLWKLCRPQLLEWATKNALVEPIDYRPPATLSVLSLELAQAITECQNMPYINPFEENDELTLERTKFNEVPRCPHCGGSMPTYATKGRKQHRKCRHCGHTAKTTRPY